MSFFIWNDRDWQLIDARSNSVTGDYVVVRKLFVRWGNGCDTVDMKELIRAEFAKYGDIKAIEMLNHPAESEVAIELSEAYVTYFQSNCAYQAFIAHRIHGQFPIEVATVLPADSWLQNANDQSKDDLNSLCVYIKTEDGSVVENKVFSHLLMTNEPPIQLEKKLLVDMDADFSLKTWLMLARSLKNDLEYIHLKFSSESSESSFNQSRLTIEEYETRLVQVIANNCVGECFQAMEIVSKRSISMEMLHSMAPLLEPLISLIVKNPLNAHLLYALPTLCPHLRMLRLVGDWDGDVQDQPAKEWSSLKYLTLTHQRLDVKSHTEDGEKFRHFIGLNPQLETLTLDTTIDIELLKGIVKSLVNITQLSFRRSSYYRSSLLLDYLTKAESLESITITFDEAETEELEKIAIAAVRLGQMKNIKLVTLIQNYLPNTERKENFTKLSKFPITEHRNCGCHPEQRFLNFDDLIADIEVPEDLPVLVIIINTNRPDKSQDKMLQHDILNMLEETKPSFPEFIRLNVVNRGDHTVYVHIGRAYVKITNHS